MKRLITIALLFPFTFPLQGEGAELAASGWFSSLQVYSAEPSFGAAGFPDVPGSDASIGTDSQPGFSLGYRFDEHLAIETFAVLPFEHRISGEGSIAGVGELGRVKSTAPTVVLQYHFTPGRFGLRPYVGGGLSYLLLFDAEPSPFLQGFLGGPAEVEYSDELSWVVQAGFTLPLTANWQFNAAAAYTEFETSFTAAGANRVYRSSLDVETRFLSAGLVYSF